MKVQADPSIMPLSWNKFAMTAHLHVEAKGLTINCELSFIIHTLFILSAILQVHVPSAVVQPPASPEKSKQSKFMVSMPRSIIAFLRERGSEYCACEILTTPTFWPRSLH
jgi:hypothetical protein